MATEFWHGATGLGLANGFRDLGWLVEQIDVRDFLPHGRGIVSRIEARLLQKFHVADYNAAILRAVERCGATVFITVKGSFVTAGTLASLHARGVRTVNYYPDVEFEHVGTDRSVLSRYDLIVTTKTYHLDYLKDLVGSNRLAFVHHGYSPLVHRPVSVPADENDYEYDITYVGNPSPYKLAWLRHVVDAFPDRRIAIVGWNWANIAKGPAFERAIIGHAISGDFYAHLVGVSRINLALHSGPVRTPGWEDAVSTRSFEIPACGGFMLHVDNAEVRSLYDPDKEIGTFSTPGDLVGNIDRFLADADDRRAVAAAGHARAVPAYSLDARATEIANAIQRL
ncbi:glycosyltransferase [Sphingomonas donggukensis]|uniref:Glycosyltransferase n=1 Tax=Sphingomonas donggukensis TaxID=2949093 RepID=A0ABY4TRT5_9SPHN|nr:glycosyltransferase [Sphingomonas donggukensis]URW74446.1 glycosyltransferase [Sphingomonas donggukensis]